MKLLHRGYIIPQKPIDGRYCILGMKMVKVHALVFLLFFLTKSIILFIFFSTSLYFVSHHHILLASTYKFINSMKGSQGVKFFMFNIVIIALLVGSSRPAGKAHDQLFLLPVSLPPPVYEEVDDHDSEKKASDGSDESHGFSLSVWVPSLVHEVEDKEEEEAAAEKEEGENDDDDMDEYHGSDGYEEDDEGGCSEDEVDTSEDDEEERINLDRRSQEFIDKVYRKWAEELYNEGLLFLPAPRISPALASNL